MTDATMRRPVAPQTAPETPAAEARPDTAALHTRLKIALRAAESAGAILMGHYGQLDRVDEKSPIDLVTAADRDSEAQVLAELRAAFPNDRVLAEERDGHAGVAAARASLPQTRWCWVVDPLDGTTNFSHSHPQFAVSVGLLHFGRPVLGVVLAPARREIFVGGVGVPATCNGRPIAVSAETSLSRSLLASGFPYDRRSRVDALLRRVGRALMLAHGFRRGGSAALDLVELAAGRIDAFWEESLAPWDLAAGHAIVEAAGGRITSLDGEEHDLFAGSTLASNGQVHDAVRRQVVHGEDAVSRDHGGGQGT